MTLTAHEIRWSRGGHLILDGVTLQPEPGETVGILGPNGSGKSSLIRALAGVTRPDSGTVRLDGTEIGSLRRREIARRVAVVSQHSATDTDIEVVDVVRLGRIPHASMLGADAGGDDVVERVLAQTGLTDKAHRMWHTLSGGERQRVQIARALAQEPAELLLDEPTNHLDIAHQLDVLALVADLPVTSYVALHDLNLAARYCDRLLVMRAGRVVSFGPPAEVLTTELIADVYGVQTRIFTDDGEFTVVYKRSLGAGVPSDCPGQPATTSHTAT
ncbi:ABC transporter ATP-binding protein [Gordonia sp. NPDC003376]